MQTFFRGKEFSTGGIFHWEGSFREVNFPEEIYREDLLEFQYEILFICHTSSLAIQFYIQRNSLEKFSTVLKFLRGFSVRGFSHKSSLWGVIRGRNSPWGIFHGIRSVDGFLRWGKLSLKKDFWHNFRIDQKLKKTHLIFQIKVS